MNGSHALASVRSNPSSHSGAHVALPPVTFKSRATAEHPPVRPLGGAPAASASHSSAWGITHPPPEPSGWLRPTARIAPAPESRAFRPNLSPGAPSRFTAGAIRQLEPSAFQSKTRTYPSTPRSAPTASRLPSRDSETVDPNRSPAAAPERGPDSPAASQVDPVDPFASRVRVQRYTATTPTPSSASGAPTAR